MRAYNRRFAKIARYRRLKGQLGRTNDSRSSLIPGFSFSKSRGTFSVLKNSGKWAILELKEGWKTWFRSVDMPSMKNTSTEKGASDFPNPEEQTKRTESEPHLECVTPGKES
jgi:hypothetical protein